MLEVTQDVPEREPERIKDVGKRRGDARLVDSFDAATREVGLALGQELGFRVAVDFEFVRWRRSRLDGRQVDRGRDDRALDERRPKCRIVNLTPQLTQVLVCASRHGAISAAPRRSGIPERFRCDEHGAHVAKLDDVAIAHQGECLAELFTIQE